MAWFGQFCASCALLAVCAATATDRPHHTPASLEDEAASAAMLRRERIAPHRFEAAELTASGEALSRRQVREKRAPTPSFVADVQPSEPPPYCHRDYVFGKANTSQCSRPANEIEEIHGIGHVLVENEEECASAARRAGATVLEGPNGLEIQIGDEWQNWRPKGCFYFPCHQDPDSVCFWYNGADLDPEDPQGLPVCAREKYYDGPENENHGCPAGYTTILNETDCEEAALCRNMLCGVEDFRLAIKNESTFNDYPVGCFKQKEQGSDQWCVFFNPELEDKTVLPSAPKGHTVCYPEEVMEFPGTDVSLKVRPITPGMWPEGTTPEETARVPVEIK